MYSYLHSLGRASSQPTSSDLVRLPISRITEHCCFSAMLIKRNMGRAQNQNIIPESLCSEEGRKSRPSSLVTMCNDVERRSGFFRLTGPMFSGLVPVKMGENSGRLLLCGTRQVNIG